MDVLFLWIMQSSKPVSEVEWQKPEGLQNRLLTSEYLYEDVICAEPLSAYSCL